MDLVIADPPFRFNQRRMQRESGGWTPLAEQLGYALFCSSIGNTIVPGSDGQLALPTLVTGALGP